MIDAMHGLHDRLVVLVGVTLDDFIRLMLEKPQRQRGQHHSAAPADGQRKKGLPPFPGAKRLPFLLFSF